MIKLIISLLLLRACHIRDSAWSEFKSIKMLNSSLSKKSEADGQGANLVGL